MLHPHSVEVVMLDGKPVSEDTVAGANGFFLVYSAIALVTVLLISVDGFDFETNFTAMAACLNNIGPGLGMVGPTGNFSAFSDFSKLLLSFAMSLDDVIISIFVTGVNVNTLPIKVYTQIKTGVTPEINALCTLMLGATIILVVLSNVLGKVGKPRTGKQHKETAERSAAPVPAQPQ